MYTSTCITCKIRQKFSRYKRDVNLIQDIVIQFIAFDPRGDLVGRQKKKKEAKGKQSAGKAKLAKVEWGKGRERSRGKGSPDNVAHRPRSMSLETDEIDFLLALFFRFISFFFLSLFFFARGEFSLSLPLFLSRYRVSKDSSMRMSGKSHRDEGRLLSTRWKYISSPRSRSIFREYPSTSVRVHVYKSRGQNSIDSSSFTTVKCKTFSAKLYKLLISRCIQCISLSFRITRNFLYI